jgi:hypothetical protein
MGACESDKRGSMKQGFNSDSNTNLNYINGQKNTNRPSITSNNFSNNFYSQKWFPTGEKYYPIIKDSNKANLFEHKNNWQSEKIELFFSLLNLANPNNLYSLSVTIINNSRLNIESYLGDLDDNRGKNIDFGTSIVIDYFYERKQKVIIKPIINRNKYTQSFSFILSDLMGNPQRALQTTYPNFGTLRITTISLNNNRIYLEKEFSNFKFNITMFNIMNNIPSNIFFVINHIKEGFKKRPVYKSIEYNQNNIRSNLIKIESDYLCNNSNDQIFLELYSYQKFPIFLANGYFSLDLLKSNIRNQYTEIPLYNDNQQNIGLARIQYYFKNKTSYIEKLEKNKMQINLEIAIDYTKSNKPPNDPSSNHYINGYGLNDYEKAIKACCDVLARYDADQLFPVYGFGGIPYMLNGRPNNKVSHCFNINFQDNAEIHGIDNILSTYRESLLKVELSGNTKFSFFLNKVISNINKDLKYRRKENHYYILLILTDGVVNDLKDTIDLIVEASSLPLSIVIVGIGNEDFSFMEQLDGDENPLTNSQGVQRKRDIVQFIKFNNFKKNNALNIGTDFAEEVLKEIPTQIDEYYSKIGKFY